jgi:hypothetical protein
MHHQITDPDFILPQRASAADPTWPDSYPLRSVFVVLVLVTPWRAEHASLAEAITSAGAARFPDDLLIVVYAPGHRLVAVLGAHGFPVDGVIASSVR